jgi:hypothetical protein
MPRQYHYAKSSNAAVTNVIERFVGASSALVEWERNVEQVSFNGVRIGEQYSALRRPDQPMLAEAFHNGLMTADMLLSLGYVPSEIVDIVTRTPPAPDLELRFMDGRSAYAEFSRLCDEDHEKVDDLKCDIDAALKRTVTHDSALRDILSKSEPHFAFRIAPHDVPPQQLLLVELRRFIEAGPGERHPDSRPVGDLFPALTKLGTTCWWSKSSWNGANFVRFEHPQLSTQNLVEKTIGRIDAKRGKRYRERPLWLLMPIGESWRYASSAFFDAVCCGELQFDTSGFDDVIVGVTGRAISLMQPISG